MTLIPELIYKPDLLKLLRFEIIPSDDGSDDMDPGGSKYQFDWDVTGFSKADSTIDFQLDFKNADGVSSGEQEDAITVVVLNKKYFQPKHRLLTGEALEHRMLAEDGAPLETGVKLIRQMPNNEESQKLARRAAAANQSASIVTILVFVLQSYMLSVFKKVMGTLLALQIVVHLGLLNVKIPGAVTCFNSTIK